MKKIFFYNSIILFVFFTISSYVIESDNFELIRQHAHQDTLVIFDIDNTIARYNSDIGNDEWFCYLVNQKMAQGFDHHSAILLTLPTAYCAHFNLPLMLTDNCITNTINNFIAQNINVIALTSRSIYLAERTHEQLDALGIRFMLNDNNNNNELLLYLSHNPCLYRHGIIFTGNNDKGETLLAFFEAINYYPKKVIFIDDKMYHVRSLETALQDTDIEYFGIRYTGCDQYINNFDPVKAEAQLSSLSHSFFKPYRKTSQYS